MFFHELKNYSINVNGRLLDLSTPLIMAILNVTPDSFYAQSRIQNIAQILRAVEQNIVDGMDILDIGGVSTRPGADLLSESEELERIIPVIQAVANAFPNVIISVDTFRSQVARVAIDSGAHIVNDVYGGRFDSEMFETIGGLKCPYILTHSRGDASNMLQLTDYSNITKDVIAELSKSIIELKHFGVDDIIVDPGFGFAKSLDQNYQLLKHLSCFQSMELPVLVGVSRKSMVHKLLGITASEALNGTSVLNTYALLNGANILRVHDVKAAFQAKILVNKLLH
jgi:dihydropteroate synthase